MKDGYYLRIEKLGNHKDIVEIYNDYGDEMINIFGVGDHIKLDDIGKESYDFKYINIEEL
jgi:hypothetical protein